MADLDPDLPFVSVVVPTYNRARLLAACLESLRAQDYPSDSFEIVVVDDGSTDATVRIVQAAAARTRAPAVRLVRKPNGGLNSARNAGLAAVNGDPMCFVDDDVDAPPHWLQAMVEGTLRHPEAGCFGGPIRLRLEGEAPRLCGREPLGETELDLGTEETSVSRVWGANMTIRRKAVSAVGDFDERIRLYGDEELWQERYQDAGGHVWYIPDAWLWHRRTAEDLRLSRLVRSRFRRGRNEVRFHEIVGQHVSPAAEAARIPRLLAHAVRSGCAWGLLASASHAGRAWGAWRDGTS